jgi:ribonuclease E
MAGTPSASGDDTTSESNMDIETTSEVDTEELDNEEFIERLIERGEFDYHIPGQYVEEDDDDDDDDDEDDEEDDADTEDGSKYPLPNQHTSSI